MTRRRVFWLGVLVTLAACVTLALAALPEVLRRVAVSRIAAATGRAVSLDDVDLNPFTGRAVLKGFRLSQRGGPDAAVAFHRLDIGVSVLGLFSSHARLTELTLTAPTVNVTRIGPNTFDFSDLLELIPAADPGAPSVWTVTVDHLALRDGKVVARDRVTSPPSEWRLEGLSFECTGLTTQAAATPGRFALKARLNGNTIELDATAVRLDPGTAAARFSLAAVDLGATAPYVPATVAIVPRAGTVGLTLEASVERGSDGWPHGTLKGEIRARNVEIVRRDGGGTVLTLANGAVAITALDLRTLGLTLGAIELDGLAVAASRGADGAFDLPRLFAGAPPAGGPASTTPPKVTTTGPAAGTPAPAVKLERLALRNGTLTVTDRTLSPPATFVLSDLTATLRDVVWPGGGPLGYEVTASLPGGGRISATGTAALDPLETELTMSMRDAPIEPYGPYFPFRARFVGRLNADSRSRVRLADGVLTASSKGDSWIVGLAARDPKASVGSKAPLHADRVEISGVDFSHPGRARVARVTIKRPDVSLERNADGSLPLRALFTAVRGAAEGEPSQKNPKIRVGNSGLPESARGEPSQKNPEMNPSGAAEPRTPGDAQPFPMEIGTLAVEDGRIAFVDRAMQPPFTESISRLRVTIDGLSNAPGRRAKVRGQGRIGADAALEVSGEIAPLGDFYADLTAEVRDFSLPRVSPYAETAIAWVIERGRLVARVQYKVEGARLTAQNHIVVGDLEVTRAAGLDTAEQRLGLPLGMIVALIKDGQGRIVLDVPVSGTLGDPQFDWGETIWTAVRNVLVNVAAAPFRAIGRLFTRDGNKIEKLSVEPVTFAPGSTAVTADMQQHVTRIAEFLRGAPAIALSLAPVVTGEDTDRLRRQALTSRLQNLQHRRKLPDYPSAVAAEFRERFPKVTPLPSPDDQFAKLLELEPPAEAQATELGTRRLEAVRASLLDTHGIAPERLRSADPVLSTDGGGGRVELTITTSASRS